MKTSSTKPIMLNSFVFSGLIYNEGQITAASPTGLYIIGTLS